MKRFLLALACALSLCGCAGEPEPENLTITNTVTLNEKPADMSVYEWIGDEYADFRQISLAESARLIKEGGSGIIYYGYDNCPWCERAVPELNAVALEYGIPVYYVDVYSADAPTTEEVEELISLIESTFMEDENGEKAFFVPLVIGIKNGEITGSLVSLVDNFTPSDPEDQMTDAQKERQREAYREIIRKTAD